MKRSTRFVQSLGAVRCTLESGEELLLPIVPGILKHPTVDALRALLANPRVARKYTIAALRRAPWPVLCQFPRHWLVCCMPAAKLDRGRARAIEFMLG